MKTKQQIFDHVATHLLRQGAKSVDDSNTCVYRGYGGRKCAVGCLIPDEHYDKKMEGSTLSDKFVRDLDAIGAIQRALAAFIGGPVDTEMAAFIDGFRDIHDDDEVCEWPKALKRYAAKHQLSAAVVGV